MLSGKQRGSRMAKRRLTAQEKAAIHEAVLAKERQQSSDHSIDVTINISVTIDDETDEDGQPRYHVIKRLIRRSRPSYAARA
jgi:hypothetical protein